MLNQCIQEHFHNNENWPDFNFNERRISKNGPKFLDCRSAHYLVNSTSHESGGGGQGGRGRWAGGDGGGAVGGGAGLT